MSLKQRQASCGPPFPFPLPPCSLEEALTQPDSSSFDPGIPTSVKQNGCFLSITGASYKKNLQQERELEVLTGWSQRLTAELGQQVAMNTSSLGCSRVCRRAHRDCCHEILEGQ